MNQGWASKVGVYADTPVELLYILKGCDTAVTLLLPIQHLTPNALVHGVILFGKQSEAHLQSHCSCDLCLQLFLLLCHMSHQCMMLPS